MRSLKEMLFEKTYQAYQEYAKLPRRTPEQNTAWERFDVLWSLIEDADLEADYSEWRTVRARQDQLEGAEA